MPVKVWLSPKDPLSGWRLASEEIPENNDYRAVVIVTASGHFNVVCGWRQGVNGGFWEFDALKGTSEDDYRVLMGHDTVALTMMTAIYGLMEGPGKAHPLSWDYDHKHAEFAKPEYAKERLAAFVKAIDGGVFWESGDEPPGAIPDIDYGYE